MNFKINLKRTNKMNSVNIIGRLTRDPEIFHEGEDIKSLGVKCSIACNEYKKGNDKPEASFFDIIAWGKTADILIKYTLKGEQIAVNGRLKQEHWESEHGTRYAVKIIANNITLTPKDGNNNEEASSNSERSTSRRSSSSGSSRNNRDNGRTNSSSRAGSSRTGNARQAETSYETEEDAPF